jgi:hypothetical protein
LHLEFAADTDKPVIWRGADPFVVITNLSDVNFTTVSFDFNSSSGTFDQICVE